MSKKQSIMFRFLLAWACLSTPINLSAQQTAHDLVALMFDRSKQLSYSGLFTHEMAGEQRTVKVSHQVSDGAVYERITHMDGPVKDRLRQPAGNHCNFRDANSLQAQDHYRFDILGESRVAGRKAHRVRVSPKDSLRYGYLYSIDQQTGLMLQSILVNQSGQPLENFKYMDISMDPIDDGSTMAASADVAGAVASDCVNDSAASNSRPWQWSVQWVPPGFVQVSRRITEDGRESMAYTDGIAVFSVLIDLPSASPVHSGLSARLGPTQMVVINREHDDSHYRVAVSGQMPQATASRIALSIKPVVASQREPDMESVNQ